MKFRVILWNSQPRLCKKLCAAHNRHTWKTLQKSSRSKDGQKAWQQMRIQRERRKEEKLLLLLLLSRFSHVRLCATPQTAAHQALPVLGFSRQEPWSGLPFPSPMCESEVAQSCLTLSNLMDCSLPGSSIHGVFQARVLEGGKAETIHLIRYKVEMTYY